MKLLIILVFVTFAGLPESKAELQSKCPSGSFNLKKLISILEENLNSLAVCDSGSKAELIGDCLRCIQEEETILDEANGANVAKNCPSFGCPPNPTCNPGFHLLVHGDNCCCVKEDLAKSSEKDEPKICPLCSMDEPGDINCNCIFPHKLINSMVDPTTSCCF